MLASKIPAPSATPIEPILNSRSWRARSRRSSESSSTRGDASASWFTRWYTLTLCGVHASQRGLARFGWGGEDALCEAAADALDADEPEDEPERKRTAVAPAVEETHRGL